MPTQQQMFYSADRRIADGNAAFMEMVRHETNPMTREDLAALIKRRPERWNRFAGFLDTLPTRADIEARKAAKA